MTTTITLQASGLNLSPNQLALPAGSLSVAENVIIRRENVIEPRRGMFLYGDQMGTSGDRAKQLIVYKTRILRHFESTIQFDNGSGTFTSFDGDYLETETGLRIKSIEANGNLYFTTSKGIKKISAVTASDFTSAPGYIVNAGGLKALDITATLNDTPSTGAPWFLADSVVAYRVLWGIKDVNSNLILGTPSERFVIYNPLLNLVIKDFLSVLGALDDINQAGSLITDGNYVSSLKLPITASSSDLYTNLIALAKKLDTDIYLANSSGAGVPLTIATPPSSGLAISGTTATLTFSSGNPTQYISIGDTIGLQNFAIDTGTKEVTQITCIADVANSLQSKYFNISSANNTTQYYVWYNVSGGGTDPAVVGATGIEVDINTNDVAVAVASATRLAISAISDFTTTGATDQVIVTNVIAGETTDATDGAAPTGFTISITTQGTNVTTDNDKLNAPQIVTGVTSTTVTFNTTLSGNVTTLGDIYSGNYGAITEPPTQDIPATHDEIASLQGYLSSIIDRLQSELSGVISAPLQTAYITPLAITEALTTNLEITVPQNATVNHFFQVYRSDLLTATGTDVLFNLLPSDELKLDYEANPTQAQLDAGIITLEDITPDDFLGANLYTNPSSGEGILQANDVPPWAKDINRFKDYTFYANTKTLHRLTLNLLGVQNLIDQITGGNTPTLTIASSNTFSTYQFILGEQEETDIVCPVKASVPVSGYFTLNSANNSKEYYVWYDTTGSDVDPVISGKTGIRVDISALTTATEVASRTRDVISIYVDYFLASSSTNTVTVLNVAEGFANDSVLGPGMLAAGFTATVTNQGVGELAEKQVSQVVTVADVAGSLAGKYFTINDGFDVNRYYVWYKVSGVGADPAIAGSTGIEVDITTNDGATAVATATNTAISSIFSVSQSTNTLTITNPRHGPAQAIAAATSGFTVSVVTNGALKVLVSQLVSPAQAVDATLRSFIRIVNFNTASFVNLFQLSSTQDIPGKFLAEAKSLEDVPFYFLGDSSVIGESFSPTISPTLSISAIGTGTTPTVTTSTNHGLATGNAVVITNSDSIPPIDGYHLITVTSPTTFTIPFRVLTGGSRGSLINAASAEISENEVKPNRIYYSKFQQPEAVPIGNFLDVGAKDQQILRIFPLRDSLFIFKQDGVYRLSGEIAPFNVALFDSTSPLKAPDSVCSSQNLIFGWFQDGIATVSETGIDVISRPIDNVILKLASKNYPNFPTATYGIGYDPDDAYLIFTINETTDTRATICYRFNTLTKSWTTFQFGGTCGIIGDDETMYIGAEDTNYLSKERKTFDRSDYSDREFADNIQPGSYIPASKIILFPNVLDYDAGDVLYQNQTLTVYDFNITLRKLDTDTILSDTDYFSSLQVSAGVNLNLQLNALLTKIAADSGNSFYTGTILPLPGSTFNELKTKFNLMITTLNTDSAVGWSNYQIISNSTVMEMRIISVNKFTKKVTISENLDFVVGAVTIFKAIRTKIRWSPNLFGDAVSYKHIREATLMTDANAWTEMKLNFATDLLPSLEGVVFQGDGNGAFGLSNPFGENFFGGTSNSAGIRTLVPRNKQRCRYMVIQIDHDIAREHFNVFGVSLTGMTGISTRAYR